jgi:Fe-S-cluster containining protein
MATTTRRRPRRRRTIITTTDQAGAEAGRPADRAPLWPAEALTQQAAARSEAFGYVCNRCSLCCQHKVIQVNPYEIARLARGQGVSTAEFREKWTQDGDGAHLARDASDTCVFLGPQGCTVHQDRPLVCRIYPLGRHVTGEGEERWSHVEPHPQTAGVYSKHGTVADYLAAQGAAPFMQATDEYATWLRRAFDALATAGRDGEDAAGETPDLLDMDAMVSAYCHLHGQAEPIDIEARKALHLTILDAWLLANQGKTL